MTATETSARPMTPGTSRLTAGWGGVHWAGNLNVFVGGRDVERHMAQALRVYPGRVNLAMFVVGSGAADEYRFELNGDGTAWNARLFNAVAGHPLLAGMKTAPVK